MLAFLNSRVFRGKRKKQSAEPSACGSLHMRQRQDEQEERCYPGKRKLQEENEKKVSPITQQATHNSSGLKD
jgi:hypothetical protein